MSDSPRLTVVLTFNQLPLKLLSCYGSELGQTPVLDRLASQGVLGDLHFVDDLAQERTRHAWWDGAADPHSAADQPLQTLAEIATQAGVECRLISDCQPFAWDIAPQGWNTNWLEPDSEEELSPTAAFERLHAEFERALEDVRRSQQSAIVWVHSAELPVIPIPSMEFLELFLDEFPGTPVVSDEESEELSGEDVADDDSEAGDAEQADALESLTEADRAAAFEMIEETLSLLSEGSAQLEPVHIKTWNVLAAARLAECDCAIGRFFERIEPLVHAGEALFLLTADRGLPLGEMSLTKRLEAEHLQGPLQEEAMHVPLLLMTGERKLGRRLGSLTTHADVPATILDWLGIEHEFPQGRSLLPLTSGKASEIHPQLVSTAGDWQAIREREWLLVRNRAEGVEKLYIKPEDRWQVLDVLSQNVDEADRLIELLDRSVKGDRL